MHHFRGKLLEEGRPKLDPANLYIQFHHASDGGAVESWNGYVLVASESDLEPGGSFRMELVDGRSGTLRIDHLAADESGKFRAYFIGDGPLG